MLVFFFLFEELGYVTDENLYMINGMPGLHSVCTYDDDLDGNEQDNDKLHTCSGRLRRPKSVHGGVIEEENMYLSE